MQIAVEKNELYQIIKQAVRDVIREESGDLWLNFLNYVSDKEMSDLIETYGKPDKEQDIYHSETIEI